MKSASITARTRLSFLLSTLSIFSLSLLLSTSTTFAQSDPDENDKHTLPAGAASAAGKTEINVKNADIAAIIKIFSKKTKRNYILDERVKGKVSIYLPGKVSQEDSLRILDSVLAFKGFTSVPIGDNLWKILQAKKQSSLQYLQKLEKLVK